MMGLPVQKAVRQAAVLALREKEQRVAAVVSVVEMLERTEMLAFALVQWLEAGVEMALAQQVVAVAQTQSPVVVATAEAQAALAQHLVAELQPGLSLGAYQAVDQLVVVPCCQYYFLCPCKAHPAGDQCQ